MVVMPKKKGLRPKIKATEAPCGWVGLVWPKKSETAATTPAAAINASKNFVSKNVSHRKMGS
jgi:hypothetical protein